MTGWPRVRLDAVTNEVRRVVLPSGLGVRAVFHYSIPTWDETGDGATEDPAHIGSGKLLLAGDEVLVSKLNPRKTRVLETTPHEQPTVASTEFVALRPAAGMDRRFLCYLLRSEVTRQTLAGAVQSVTRSQQRVNPDDVTKMWLRLPPCWEQRAIADFLDAETARIDALVARRLSMLPLLRERLTSAVDHELTAVSGRETPLMRLVPDDRQIMYGIVLPGPNVDDGVPIVKGGDVGAGRLHPDVLAKTTQEIEASFARARLQSGDVLVAIRGSIGEGAVVPPALKGANITQDVARVSPRPGIDSSWLLYALASTQAAAQMASRTTGATIRGLNIWDLERITVSVPSVEDQRHVAARLDSRNASYQRSRLLLTEQIDLLSEHRQALITAAVTGEIDVTKKAS